MWTKKKLAKELSKLEGFQNPKPWLEQYMTDSETASFMLWNAYMLGDVEGKTILDLGSGTGVLGIGALLLGADKVVFIDIDEEAINVLKQNLKAISIPPEKYEVIKADVTKEDFLINHLNIDVVVQNPPFGIQKHGMDVKFLTTSLNIASVVYSLHDSASLSFLKALQDKLGFRITHHWSVQLMLKQTMKFHKARVKRIQAVMLRLQKNA